MGGRIGPESPLRPDLAFAYYNRGIAYRNLSQHRSAIENYNEAIRLQPDFLDAYTNRGFSYFMQGNKVLGCIDAQKICTLGHCQLLEWAKNKRYCR